MIMKKTILYLLPLLTVLLCGCKEDNWMDWKLQNQIWLEQNAKQEGVVTTPSGLQYKISYMGKS